MIEVFRFTTNDYHLWNTPEFNELMRERTVKILNKIKSGISVFNIDNDVILFKSEKYFMDKLTEDLDIIAQREHNGTMCCGFMILRASDKMVAYLTECLKEMDRFKSDDQIILNRFWADYKLKIGFFPYSDITSYGIISGGRKWKGQSFVLPPCKAFHANYVVGWDKKRLILERVKEYQKSWIEP